MSESTNVPLPWAKLPAASIGTVPPEQRELQLSLYHVTGPYMLSAYVVATDGGDAIASLTYGDTTPWSKLGVWPDQCQAESLAQTAVLKREWTHLLADLGSPHGLAFQKA